MVIILPKKISAEELKQYKTVKNNETQKDYKTKYLIMNKLQKFQILIHNTKNYLNEKGEKFVMAEDLNYESIKNDWNYLEKLVVPKLENAYKTKELLSIKDVENMVKSDVKEKMTEEDDLINDLEFVDMDPVIQNLEECSNLIQEYSYKLNELKSKNRKSKQLLSEVKSLDSSLSKFFNKKNKKFNERDSNQYQKLLKSYEKLKPIFNQVSKVQISDDVYQDYNKAQEITQKKEEKKQQAQLDKPIIDKWTKATVDVEFEIAKETRDELIKMESEYDELHEMENQLN
eukprot:gene1974-1482_t